MTQMNQKKDTLSKVDHSISAVTKGGYNSAKRGAHTAKEGFQQAEKAIKKGLTGKSNKKANAGTMMASGHVIGASAILMLSKKKNQSMKSNRITTM